MKVRFLIVSCFICFLVRGLQAQESQSAVSEKMDQGLLKNIPVHDPVMIKQGNTYYLFATGRGIAHWSSTDMQHWKQEKPVFPTAPEWAVAAVPTFKNHIWAPDISYYKGKYYLYYSISAFGKNTSCIGLVTNTTLNPNDKNYKWVDQGKVIESIPGKNNWNAIDPNLVTDQKGNPYLAFGSFWEGLKLIKLKKDRQHLAENSANLLTIASRKPGLQQAGNRTSTTTRPVVNEANPIEAPFIFKKGNYYYLFASIDYCCKGINSTYKMIVGRSGKIEGPYLDKAGVSMSAGGGTLVLAGDSAWYGVGHNSAYTFDGKDFLVFHGYDAADNGRAKLRIEPLSWDEQGWPVLTNK